MDVHATLAAVAPATLPQLEQALPGADSNFLLQQLRAGASVDGAAQAMAAQLQQQLTAAQSTIQTLTNQVAGLQQQLAQAQATNNPSARERELQAQLEFATKSRGQHAPIRERHGSLSNGGGSAKQQCESLRDELVAGGMEKTRAWCKVMDDHPDLRQQMIAEANGRAA